MRDFRLGGNYRPDAVGGDVLEGRAPAAALHVGNDQREGHARDRRAGDRLAAHRPGASSMRAGGVRVQIFLEQDHVRSDVLGLRPGCPRRRPVRGPSKPLRRGQWFKD